MITTRLVKSALTLVRAVAEVGIAVPPVGFEPTLGPF